MLISRRAHCLSRLIRHRILRPLVVFWVSFYPSVTPTTAQDRAKAPGSSFSRIAAQADRSRDANDLDKALTFYRKALGIKPSWAEGWWSLGTILYDRDNYAEAVRAFQRVLALQPQHGSARVMLGLCEFELGQDAGALRDIQKGKQLGVLQDSQLRQVMLYHEGILLLRKSNFEGAQEVLDSLSREGAKGNDLILAMGMSVLRIRPENLPPEGSTVREIAFRAGKAESFAAAKKFDDARREYGSLVTENPELANIHYAYGRFLLEIHEVDVAVTEFQSEIQNDSSHVLARLEIAAAKYRIDSADGVKYAEQAVKLEPELPFGHYLLGLLYLDTQNLAEAISELQTARRFYPNMPEIYFALGNAYARAGRKQEAARARAIFTRLNALKKKETTDSVYGGKPSGLIQRPPDPQATPKPLG
jgi:tetratricopeptide (TPR) repeat protein